MQKTRKEIIRYALDQDIDDIHTYAGYKGDLVVKITSKERNTVLAIRHYALTLDIEEVVIKKHPTSEVYEIYCITPDEHVYHLKAEDEADIKTHHSEKDDVWNKTVVD